jgi:hypothetical protein
MSCDKLTELIEINLFFAKSELCQLTDPSAPARALLHIEAALKELRMAKRGTRIKRKTERKVA